MVANDRRAVLLGVVGTAGGFDPLPGAAKDVESMTIALETHRDRSTLNFEVTSKVVDEANPWSVGALLETIEIELSSAAHFVFYFSGHGEVTPFGLQLVTPNSNRSIGSGDQYDLGVYFDVLLHRFNAAGPGTEVTVILDCCYSGAAGDMPTPGTEILERFTHLRDGITILASSGRELPSWAPASGPSDFTAAVYDCLEADEEQTDILDVYKWTKRQIPGQAPVLRTFGSKHSSLRSANREASVDI